MSSWSFKRFTSFFALETMGNLRKIAMYAGCMTFVYLVLAFLTLPDIEQNSDKVVMVIEAIGFNVISALMLFVAMIMGAIWASRAFKAYNKRETAWMQIMLPASRAEKFVVAYLLHALIVPFIFVALIVGSYLAISALWPSLSWSAMGVGRETTEFFDYLTTLTVESLLLFIAYIFTGWLSTQTFYFAGSSVFKKFPFLLTMLGVLPLTGFISNMVLPELNSKNMSNAQGIADSIQAPLMALCGINIFWIIVAFAIAWVFYRRRTVP